MLLAENQRLSVMLSRAIRISSVILLFVLASASLCADNLLRNPGFRSFGDDGLPAEWKLSMASGMDAVLKILPAAGPEKQNVLSLVNRSGKGSRMALRQFLPLKAGTLYQLTCRARGKAGGYLSFALGSKWQKRLWIRGGEKWTRYTLKFQPEESEFSWKNAYEICLLAEDDCEVEVIDVELFPDDPAVLIANGDFTRINADGRPEAWSYSPDAGMDVTVKVVTEEGGRRNVLAIDNNSNYGGGRLAMRQFLPLKAGQLYELSCKVKGNAGGFLSFALGNKWQERLWLRRSEDWREYRLRFTPQADRFSWKDAYEVCLLVEDVCHARIADVMLKPLNTLTPVAAGYSRMQRIAVIPQVKFDPAAKAIPAGMPVLEPELVEKFETPSREDLSCRAALGWDGKGLIFYADVTDGGAFISRPGEGMWSSDCVQLAIEPDGRLKNGRDSGDLEIGFTRGGTGPDNYCWTEKRRLNSEELEYDVRRTETGYFIAARISWQLMPQILKNPGGAFSFNLTVNDSDRDGERKGISLSPGVFVYKSSRENVLAFLEGKPFSARFLPDSEQVTSELTGRLIVNDLSAPFKLRAVNASGEHFELPLAVFGNGTPAVAEIHWDFSRIPGGNWNIEVISGENILASAEICKADFFGDFNRELAILRERYAKLKPELEARRKIPRFKAIQTIFDHQLALLEADIRKSEKQEEKDYYGKRGLRVTAELNDLADLAGKLFRAELPPESRYVSSKRVLKDGWIEAETVDATGNRHIRPVIFSGYGHFDTAVRDIPMFSSIGADMIQFEVTMHSVMRGENPDGSFQVSFETPARRLSGIDSAWKNNVAVALLLGTHYLPDWAGKAHPEMLWNSGSFLQFDVQHPYSRKLVGEFVRQTVRHVRNMEGAGSIHSICISNEPRYQPSLRSGFTRSRFIERLKALYENDIDKLNRKYGTRYADFDAAVPNYDPQPDSLPGLYYDFVIFKLDEFADWHNWMAGIVEEEWPGMAVHSKVLGGFGIGGATDYERFGKFSTLNGTDNGIGFNQRTGQFTRGEMILNLASSMNPVSIINTENHLIPDDVEEPVSYDAVYCCAFQQYVHGVAGSAAWVWEDYDLNMFRNHHVFVGDIYRRPMGILAVRDAAADANRLVNELREAYAAPARVALLYSIPSAIFNEKYESACKEAWHALARAGRKIRFVSEDQLKRGETAGIELIVATEATVLTPEAADALKRFAESGGTVVQIGKGFEKTPYGEPLEVKIPAKTATFSELGALADGILGKLPVQICSESPDVEWRATPTADGGWLVNAVNFGKTPVEINIDRNAVELIRNRPVSEGKFLLLPMQPQLFKMDF